MPQFDFLSFYNQIFWFFIIVILFYFCSSFFILPNLSFNIKLKKKKIKYNFFFILNEQNKIRKFLILFYNKNFINFLFNKKLKIKKNIFSNKKNVFFNNIFN